MRIAQLANFYTPTSGGLRTCLEEIGRGYLAQGHERTLIVPGETDLDEETESGRRITMASPPMPGGPYRVLRDRDRVRSVLDATRPDVLEISDKLSVTWLARWARRRQVPVILFSHERLDAILSERVPAWVPLPSIADVVNRRLSGVVDTVIAASAFSAEEFVRLGVTNVRMVPLGVDLEVFAPVETKPAEPGPVSLVTVGRLSTEKSPQLAIDALRVLTRVGVPARLTMLGEGPLRQQLERRAAGLDVTFLGHRSRDEVARIVAMADVAISPSSVESFGLATLEALACGTPVVVPNAGAARELVQHPGSGAVCAPTGEGLARGVRQLLDTPLAVRRRAARTTAERYPWSATVGRLTEEYAALLQGAGVAL